MSEEMDASLPAEPAAARQTKRYLQEMLASCGLRPLKQLGQNFLIDLNILDVIVNESGIGASDVVLEIGGGTGSLTTRLAQKAGFVVVVEVDRGFQQLLARRVESLANVQIVGGDALQSKNKINPAVMAALAGAMGRMGVDHAHLVANLPFDAATSAIGNLLLEDTFVKSMTVTVQFEVGQRILARAGTPDYSPLSILVQWLGEGRWVRTLPPSVFWPRPKVTSAVIKIVVDESRRTNLKQLRAANRFVRDLFLHRRKNLRAAVASIPGLKRLKGSLDDVFESIDVNGTGRAEALQPEKLLELFTAVAAAAASGDMMEK